MNIKKNFPLILVTAITTGLMLPQKSMAADSQKQTGGVHLFYRDECNFPFAGLLGYLHPFDLTKYRRVYDGVSKELKKNPNQNVTFCSANEVTKTQLTSVHSDKYLKSLQNNREVLSIAELNPPTTFDMLRTTVRCLATGQLFAALACACLTAVTPIVDLACYLTPSCLLDRLVLRPMRFATGATIAAVEKAVETKGCVINIGGGGYHHAKAEHGGGFCYYADINIAMKEIWKKHPKLKVLVIDLDAHQGNGHEQVFGQDARVRILDMYNAGRYPYIDKKATSSITYNYALENGTKKKVYLETLSKGLLKALGEDVPDLIIYNAGTDPLKGDLVGGLKVSRKGLIKRDEMVLKAAQKNNTPIVILPSGGYTQESANVIIDSITQNAIPLYGQQKSE